MNESPAIASSARISLEARGAQTRVRPDKLISGLPKTIVGRGTVDARGSATDLRRRSIEFRRQRLLNRVTEDLAQTLTEANLEQCGIRTALQTWPGAPVVARHDPHASFSEVRIQSAAPFSAGSQQTYRTGPTDHPFQLGVNIK